MDQLCAHFMQYTTLKVINGAQNYNEINILKGDRSPLPHPLQKCPRYEEILLKMKSVPLKEISYAPVCNLKTHCWKVLTF